ncbi:MAG: hypothetical protein ACXWVO_01620 [Caulobacteraceae bacterium]
MANEGGKKKNESPFVSLRPVVSTVSRANGRPGSLSVEVGLNVPDPKLRERAAQSQPLLRDAYLSVLQPYAMRMQPGSPPDVDYLVRAFQKATDRVLGKPGARVLLGSVMIN